MNKYLLSLIFIAVKALALQAEDFALEARAGYFYPTSKTFRDIYDSGILTNLEASYKPHCRIFPFVSAGLLLKSGHTETLHTKTRVTIVPIALGLKYQFCWRCVRPYIGVGPLVSYLHTKDESPYVVKVRNKWNIGAILKTGLIYDLDRCLFADLYLDYYWSQRSFSNTDKTTGTRADISGLAVGAGLGYRF